MAFPTYIAWLNGCSVASGSLAHCKAEAAKVVRSARWQSRHPGPATVRITQGARQLFAAALEIRS